MISEIRIQNFKSIQDLTLKPGRVTVLIGANGSGKSNILEAIAFAAGASAERLDNVFLSSLGIRVTEDTWMRSAFPEEAEDHGKPRKRPIHLTVKGDEGEPNFECQVSARVRSDDRSFIGWSVRAPVLKREVDEATWDEEIKEFISLEPDRGKEVKRTKPVSERSQAESKRVNELLKRAIISHRLSLRKKKKFAENALTLGLADFLIYAPENMTLRTPPAESAVLPLGVKGEGLLTLLQSFADPKLKGKTLGKRLGDLKQRLHLFGWFEDLIVPDDEAAARARLELQDRWLAPDRAVFDQRSANEGFLYVLFYFVLMMSWRTPKFFAIDNLDNALNPKLCAVLMKQIVQLAKTYGKQVICTVHNPAVLDGLDLGQDDQRLFTVRRGSEGRTLVRRIHAPRTQEGEEPIRLSEAFTHGLIGGLPDNF